MSATASAELIDELEGVLRERSAEGRARTLQRLSELLLSCAERLNPSQISIFDDVLVRLLDCVGTAALVELSNALAGCRLTRRRPSESSRITRIRR